MDVVVTTTGSPKQLAKQLAEFLILKQTLLLCQFSQYSRLEIVSLFTDISNE